jgi:hypothetical protein
MAAGGVRGTRISRHKKWVLHKLGAKALHELSNIAQGSIIFGSLSWGGTPLIDTPRRSTPPRGHAPPPPQTGFARYHRSRAPTSRGVRWPLAHSDPPVCSWDSVGWLGPTQAPQTGPEGAHTFIWASFAECAPAIRPTVPTTTHILPHHTPARPGLPRRGHATAQVGADVSHGGCRKLLKTAKMCPETARTNTP